MEEQEKIHYADVMRLGFKDSGAIDDTVFFNEHGFDYHIVELKLTKRLYLDWDCATRTVTFHRLSKTEDGFIAKSANVDTLTILERLIDFHKEE